MAKSGNEKSIVKKISPEGVLKKLDIFDRLFEENDLVGIDVGAYSVKVVNLKNSPKGVELSGLGYKEIPKPSEAKSSVKQDDLISECINDILHEQKIKTRNVRLVISDPSIYLRQLTIPKVAEEELSKAVKWQAEKYAPFPIDDAIVDYQTVASNKNDDHGQMKIIIVAVKKEVIERYLSILRAVKLTPMIIDVSPFACAKLILKMYSFEQEEIMPVIDIGTRTTSVSIVSKDSIHLVRNIDIAGSHISQAIAKGRGVSIDEAEKVKRGSTLEPISYGEGQQTTAFLPLIEPTLVELVQQIERSIAYLEREFHIEKIKRVVLCGGGSKLNGLCKYLSEKLRVSVELADPLNSPVVNKGSLKLDGLEKESAKFTSALGVVI